MKKNLIGKFELGLIALAFAVAAVVIVIREGLTPPAVFTLLLMAVFAAVIGVVEWLDHRAAIDDERFRRSGVCVKGRVMGIDEIRGRGVMGWDVSAEFEYQGKSFLTASRRQRSRPRVGVGDEVNIWLMPEDPNDSRILDADLM